MNDKEFLTYFEALASADEKGQSEAVEKILKTLLALSHTPGHNLDQVKNRNPKSFGKASGHLLPDVDYTLKRLIQGTTSDVLSTQIAFSIPLRHILQHFDEIDIMKYINFVAEECNIKNALKKSEKNHFILAKILCLRALILSGRMEKHAANAADPQQIYIEVYDDIILVMENYPWARSASCEALRSSVELDSGKSAKSLKMKINMIYNKLKGFIKNNEPHILGILLSLYSIGRKHKVEVSFKNLLESKILNFDHLASFLTASIDWFPKETGLAKAVVNYLFEQEEEEEFVSGQKSVKELWESFWKYFVKGFAQQESSNVKTYFQVLSLLKAFLKHPQFSLKALSYIMHEGLIQLWCRNLMVLNEHTQRLARKAEKHFKKHIEEAVKRGITEEERRALFDFLCMSKIREGYRFNHKSDIARTFFIDAFSEEERTKYYKFLKKQIAAEPAAKIFYLNELYIFAHFSIDVIPEKLYISICCLLLHESDKEVIADNLRQVHASGDEDDDIEVLVKRKSKKFKTVVSDYFYSLLNNAIRRVGAKVSENKNIAEKSFSQLDKHRIKGLCADNQPWLLKVYEEAVKFEKKKNAEKGEEDPANKRNRIKRKKYLNLATEIQNKFLERFEAPHEKAQPQQFKLTAKRLLSFESLFLSVCIESFHFPDESFDILDELGRIYEEMCKAYMAASGESKEAADAPKKKRKLNNGSEAEGDESKFSFIEVLVEVFISLLTKSHAFLREAVKACFKQFVDILNESSLTTLVEVITRKTEDYLEDMVEEEED